MASDRIPKVNKHIQRVFGEILLEQADLPADAMVTIAQVETRPNLRSAIVYLYVFPVGRGEEVIERLTPQMYELQGALNRALDFHPLPRITLRLDNGAQYADHINQTFDSLKE